MNRAVDVQGRPGAHARQLLEEMLRIRRFEERCAELYTEEKIRGFLHLYIGEEAIAVGVMRALSAEDAVVATYREHGHALARGVLMAEVMAEMYGKFEGCSRGRGGSMHLFDRKSRFYGGNAIVGGGLPLAVGLALAEKMQGRAAIAACFFGEGAVAEGEFHESMNLAQLWQLPVLFVCENNLYAMGTRLDLSESQTNIVAKAESYGMVAECVDGMDVCAVETAAGRLAQEVRTQQGPRFLECKTYRFHAHSMFDPQLYRSKEEVEEWKGKGPIRRLTTELLEERLLDDAALKEIEARVAREIEDAVRFAETGSWEPTASLLRDVGAEART
jgi:pyruvate dehydrogenase E1 component alpha subunit